MKRLEQCFAIYLPLNEIIYDFFDALNPVLVVMRLLTMKWMVMFSQNL